MKRWCLKINKFITRNPATTTLSLAQTKVRYNWRPSRNPSFKDIAELWQTTWIHAFRKNQLLVIAEEFDFEIGGTTCRTSQALATQSH